MSSSPYGYGTYVPLSQQQQQPQQSQDPFLNAYNGGPNRFGSGPAQVSILGTTDTPQAFMGKDQSFIPDMETNFDQDKYKVQGNQFGTGYSNSRDQYHMGDWTSYEADNGLIPVNGPQTTRTSFDTYIPTSNLKTDFDSFHDAQKYYRNYFNETQAYLKNALPWHEQWLRGNSLGWTPVSEKMISGLSDVVKAREQAALKKYLEVYNYWGHQGAFGSDFKDRSTPFSL